MFRARNSGVASARGIGIVVVAIVAFNSGEVELARADGHRLQNLHPGPGPGPGTDTGDRPNRLVPCRRSSSLLC